jgi:hypothetical protein
MIAARIAFVACIAALTASPSWGNEPAFGQMCWAHDVAGKRVYYAENYVTEDRSKSFEALMELAGVEFAQTTCFLADVGDFEARRDRLFAEWASSGLHAVNTTFLSDQDY